MFGQVHLSLAKWAEMGQEHLMIGLQARLTYSVRTIAPHDLISKSWNHGDGIMVWSLARGGLCLI